MKRYLGYSSILHIGFFGLIFLYSFIRFGPHLLDFSQKKLVVKSVAVRVDVVSMPKMTLREQRQWQLVPLKEVKEIKEPSSKKPMEMAVKEKSEDSFFEDEKKRKWDSLLKRIHEKPIKDVSSGHDLKKNSEELKNLIFAGNKISHGAAVTGDVQNTQATEFSTYIGHVLNLIRAHWKLPGYLSKSDLKCRLRIFIGKEGQLLDVSVYEKSGHEDFDERAILAIRSAAPFPVPSLSVLSKVEAGEIVLGFPL